MELSEVVNEVADKIDKIMSHPSGQAMLIRHPVMQRLFYHLTNKVANEISVQIRGHDRQQVERAMHDLFRDRQLKQKVGAEVINVDAYGAILEDLRMVHQQLPSPQANVLPEEQKTSGPIIPLPHQVTRDTPSTVS